MEGITQNNVNQLSSRFNIANGSLSLQLSVAIITHRRPDRVGTINFPSEGEALSLYKLTTFLLPGIILHSITGLLGINWTR